jgi:hypothetical protein
MRNLQPGFTKFKNRAMLCKYETITLLARRGRDRIQMKYLSGILKYG